MLTLTVLFTVLVVQKMCHQLCILLCSREGSTVALIELRGKTTMVSSDAKCEAIWLEMSNSCQNSKVARSAAIKRKHDDQIVTKKKLSDASTILCSCKPSGACFKHGNVLNKTQRPFSYVFSLTAPQERPGDFFKPSIQLPNLPFHYVDSSSREGRQCPSDFTSSEADTNADSRAECGPIRRNPLLSKVRELLQLSHATRNCVPMSNPAC